MLDSDFPQGRTAVNHVGSRARNSKGKMSCMHHQSCPQRDRSSVGNVCPHSYNSSPTHPLSSKPYSDVFKNECRTKPVVSEPTWNGPNSYTVETSAAAWGDQMQPDVKIQPMAMKGRHKVKSSKYDDPIYNSGSTLEKMQARLKYLEDSNAVIHTRTHNLLVENKGLVSQLDEQRCKNRHLEEKTLSLQQELHQEKTKLEQMKEHAEEKSRAPMVDVHGTNTDRILMLDRGVQVWAVCKGCQRKLESCERQPPTVTITKTELEALEKDMQTLRDAVIAREEAWDKAMEREQNYHQQLTRLTTEAITARHLSESRQEELQTMSSTLTEKEVELKTAQKDNQYLNKLIAKLYSHYQRSYQEAQESNPGVEISEKDQKIIDDVMSRMCNTKGKKRPSPRSNVEKGPCSATYSRGTPRECKTPKSAKV